MRTYCADPNCNANIDHDYPWLCPDHAGLPRGGDELLAALNRIGEDLNESRTLTGGTVAKHHREVVEGLTDLQQTLTEVSQKLGALQTLGRDVAEAVRKEFSTVGSAELALLVRRGEAKLKRSGGPRVRSMSDEAPLTPEEVRALGPNLAKLREGTGKREASFRATGGPIPYDPVTKRGLEHLRDSSWGEPLTYSEPPRQVVVDGVVHSPETYGHPLGLVRCTCLWTAERHAWGNTNGPTYASTKAAVLEHLDRMERFRADRESQRKSGPAVAKPRTAPVICECGGHCDPDAVEEFNEEGDTRERLRDNVIKAAYAGVDCSPDGMHPLWAAPLVTAVRALRSHDATEEPETCDCGEHGNGGCLECNPNLAAEAAEPTPADKAWRAYLEGPATDNLPAEAIAVSRWAFYAGWRAAQSARLNALRSQAPEPIRGDADNPPWHSESELTGAVPGTEWKAAEGNPNNRVRAVTLTPTPPQMRAVRDRGSASLVLTEEQTAALKAAWNQ